MTDDDFEPTLKDQIDARYTLMESARMAYRSRVPRETWEKHPKIKELCSKYKLHPDILHHVASYVWTPIKRW